MERFGDLYLDLNQTETNIDDINLNAVWVELDKGLLSDNIGQQSESIFKFGELFDKFPLPMFVNSGFIRLAKIFQNGNNYLKLQVIRVIERNQKHLQKILNVEEICNLLFYNIHSNDSICRALTLRALAEISPIISEKHNVQHSIRLALESHDETEAKEAIYAANKFCALSKSFAASLFDRITEMIEDIQSPLDRKMKLIPLLIHMHSDTILSSKAKNLCKAMYFSFPRADISKIILNTLTQIACKSLTNIDETITFFLKLLHEEPREKIHLFLLKNLNILANRVSHLWSNENVMSFIEYTNNQNENCLLLLKASEILCALAKNSNIYFLFSFNFNQNDQTSENEQQTNQQNQQLTGTLPVENSIPSNVNTRLLQSLIENMIFHENKDISYNFCQLSSTLLVLHSKNLRSDNKLKVSFIQNLFQITKNGLFAIIIDCDKSIESLDKSIKDYDEKLNYFIRHLKNSLKCTINLVKMNDEIYFKELYLFISSLLDQIGSHRANSYCETLLALCRFQNLKNTLNQLNCFFVEQEQLIFISNVFKKLIQQQHENKNLLTNNTNNNNHCSSDIKLQLKVLNLLFELETRRVDTIDNRPDYLDLLCVRDSVHQFLELNQSSLWEIFKLARMCVRYAQYELANEIYEQLSTKMTNAIFNMSTSDLSYKSWFDFMSCICKAEHLMSKYDCDNLNDLINCLKEALSLYMKAQVIFKSNCTRCLTSSSSSIPGLETSNTCFQIRYSELRSEQIKLYIHLILSTLTFNTIPAPVFQFKSSENFARNGRISQQFKYTIVELQKLTQKYKDFISECFDADEHTINILNTCKKQNECLINCINLLMSPKSEQQIKEEFYSNFLNIKSQLIENDANNVNDMNSNFVEYASELKMIESFYLNLFEKLKFFATNCEKNANYKTMLIKQFQNILIDFISMPVPLPRAFFTTLQKTQIKLIVNPNNKKTNTIPTVRSDQTLVVKIDGIINQQFKRKQPIRTIKKVQVCLNYELDTKNMPEAKFNSIKFSDVKTSLEEPKNDYFNSNILINFPYFGNYTIQVDLYILDDSDVIWRYISERHQILVKVEDDPNRQKILAAMAAASAANANIPLAPSTSGANVHTPIYEINVEKMES